MNIRVIYPGSIYDRNGAAKVVRTFAESEKLFFDYCGHHVQVLDSSTCESRDVVTHLSLTTTLKRWIVSILGQKVIHQCAQSYIGTKRHVEHVYWGRGHNIIDKYNRLGFNDDAFIFHDIFTCWGYVDYCKRYGQRVKPYILVLHTNGERFKMTLINYPILRGTRYLDVMNERMDACLKYARHIVFVSEKSANTFESNNSAYADKVRSIRNGIADNKTNANPVFDGKLRIVSVGTVCKRKNQIILIDCLKKISQYIDASLTMVGDGPALEDCKRHVKELDMEDKVRFTGPIDNVAEVLSECNLFVMSSLDEGLPIAAIEAMRAKLPLILTDVGGCSELIDGNGFIVKPNVDDISNVIMALGNDVRMQQQMSELSYRLYCEKYTLDSMISKYADLIVDSMS